VLDLTRIYEIAQPHRTADADGMLNNQIAAMLNVAPRMVTLWRGRFLEQGIAGVFKDAHRPGRTPSVTTEVNRSVELSITSSPLIGKTELRDLHGICYQLANAERLMWVQEKGGDDGD
jgi:transposase